MSSTTWNDLTCQNTSSSISCLAMRDLAMKEAEENNVHLSYLLMDPSCQRYQALADRVQEHNVQATVLSRRLCFTHDPTLKQGSYELPMSNGLPQQRWEQWTRRKDIGGPDLGAAKQINADIWNNMNDDASAVMKCGKGGMFQGFNLNTGIAYGPSAVEQTKIDVNALQSLGCCKPRQ